MKALTRLATLTLVGSFGLLPITESESRAQPPTVEAEFFAGGVDSAIGIAAPHDETGRFFVIQQSGEIMVWNGGGSVLPTPFLDINALTNSGGEQGLLGMAFHPSYSSNGFFYVNYTDLSGDTVVARYSVSAGDPNIADLGSAHPILDFVQEAVNHNGGDLKFAQDGFLYVGSGDGGMDWTNAQDTTNLLGKLLRIDIDGDDFPADPNRNYAIPADNPFVGVSGAAGEIYNLGLRNPFRFSFDRANGNLFIGDVGEGTWEEVNIGAPPSPDSNWGWPCYEGADVFQSGGCGSIGDYDFPALVLPHLSAPDNNCSVMGGFVYRGTAFPALVGWYFFNDWCTGVLWAAEPDGLGGWDAEAVFQLPTFGVTGYGETQDGEIYLAAGWQILHLIDPTNSIFTDGFESGDTTGWSSP